MAVPQLTPLPDPPSSEMTEAVFNEHADTSLVAQKTMVVEYNGTVMPWVAQQLADTQSARDAGVAARNAAQAAQLAAEQAALDATENGAAQVTLAKTQADLAKGSADAAKVSETEAGVYASLAQTGAALPVTAGKGGFGLTVNPQGTGYQLTPQAPMGRSAVSASGAVSASAHRSLIDASGALTLTFAAAATLGDGFFCYLRNLGNGVVTVAAAAGQTIDGLASGELRPGMTLLVQCDGAALRCIRVGPVAVIEVKTSGTTWTVPLGVRAIRVKGDGGSAGGGGGNGSLIGTTGAGGGGFEALVPVSPGQALTYSVGAGGIGGASGAPGGAGGNTTLTVGAATYTALGAQGTNQGPSTPPRLGGYASGPAGTLLKYGGAGQRPGTALSSNAGGVTPHGVGVGGTADLAGGLAGTAGAISFEY